MTEIVTFLLTFGVANAEEHSAELIGKLAAQQGMSGVVVMVTGTVLLLGIRYFIMGGSASTLLSQAKDSAKEVVNHATDSAKDSAKEVVNHAKDNARDVMGADNVKLVIDHLSESLSPLHHLKVQSGAAKENMQKLLHKILRKTMNTDRNVDSWVTDFEEHLAAQGRQVRVGEGLQGILRALESKDPRKVDETFQNLTDEDINVIADYVYVSVSQSNSSAGGAGSGAAHSVCEPILYDFTSVGIDCALVIVMVLVSLFVLFLWKIRNNRRSKQ